MAFSERDRRAIEEFARGGGVRSLPVPMPPGARTIPRPTPPSSEGGAFRVFEGSLNAVIETVQDHERRLDRLERVPAFPRNPPRDTLFASAGGASTGHVPLTGQLAAAGVALTAPVALRERNVFASPGTGALVAAGAPLAVRAALDPIGTVGRSLGRLFGGGSGRPDPVAAAKLVEVRARAAVRRREAGTFTTARG